MAGAGREGQKRTQCEPLQCEQVGLLWVELMTVVAGREGHLEAQ